jgi:hypothetical protein
MLGSSATASTRPVTGTAAAASSQKWLPVTTMIVAVVTGQDRPARRCQGRGASQATAPPAMSANATCPLGMAAKGCWSTWAASIVPSPQTAAVELATPMRLGGAQGQATLSAIVAP